MGVYRTDLADIARRVTPNVTEMNSWKTRSNSHGGFDTIRGITVHHTASSKKSDGQSDANYITLNADNAPISNFYIDRTGRIWVCAAGSCNHGGKGGPYTTSLGTIPQDKVNFQAISIEIANEGTGESYPRVQIENTARLCAEILKQSQRFYLDAIFAHKEWCGPGTSTPGRKIDPFGPWQGGGDWGPQQGRIDTFRSYVSHYLATPSLPDDEDDEMSRSLVRHGDIDTDRWNAYIVFSGGKFWLPTNEAIAKATEDFGYAPIPVDDVFMDTTGPVVGENPGDAWGKWKD